MLINYLKYIRLKSNMTQKKLAALVNRSAATIQAYEKMKQRVPELIAKLFCKIFNVDDVGQLTGYVKSIFIPARIYRKILPTSPLIKMSKKQPALFNRLGMYKQARSLKGCCFLLRCK